MKALLAAAGTLALLATGPAFAADPAPESGRTTGTIRPDEPVNSVEHHGIDPTVGRMAVGELIGRQVFGRDGDALATIRNVVKADRDLFAVLDNDRGHGMTERDLVIPLHRLHAEGERLTVDLDRQEITGLGHWEQDKYQVLKNAEPLARLER